MSTPTPPGATQPVSRSLMLASWDGLLALGFGSRPGAAGAGHLRHPGGHSAGVAGPVARAAGLFALLLVRVLCWVCGSASGWVSALACFRPRRDRLGRDHRFRPGHAAGAARLALAVAGFALFRLFDIFKPWPISWADRRVKGGLGVMVDDLLAGLATLLLLLLAQQLPLPF